MPEQRVEIVITSDSKGAITGIRSTDKALDGLEKKSTRTKAKFKSFGDESTKAFDKVQKKVLAVVAVLGTLAVATAAIGKFAKKAIDAEETFSKFGTVFENVIPDATKAVEDLTKNYGLSELAAKDMLSATGDLLFGMGATEKAALDLSQATQKWAVDIASYTNVAGGAQRASEALMKAMTGEREMLKAYGVVINETMVKQRLMQKGQDKLTGAALLQAKAYATVELAIEQSGKAIGDYARTSDSVANRIRRLENTFENFSIAIGQSIIKSEGFTDSFEVLEDILTDPAFIRAISEIATAFVGFLADALPLITGVIKGVTNLTSTIISAAGDVASVIRDVPVISEIADQYEGLAALIKGDFAKVQDQQIAAVKEQTEQQEKLRDALNDTRDAFGVTKEVMSELSREFTDIEDPINRMNAKILAIRFEKLIEELDVTDEHLGRIIDDFKDIEDPLRRYQKIMVAISRGKYDTVHKRLSVALKELTNETKITTQVTGDLKEEKEGVVKKTEEQIKAEKEAAKAYESTAKALKVLTKEGYQEQSKEIAALLKVWKINEKQIKNSQEATEALKKEIEKLSKTALPKEKEALEKVKKELWDVEKALEFKFPEEKWDDFADIANGLNTEILPEATKKFEETQDAVAETNKEIEEGTRLNQSFSKTFSELSTTIGNALNAISALGIDLGNLPQIFGAVSQGVNAIGAGVDAWKKSKGAASGFLGILGKVSAASSIVTGALSAVSGILKALSGPSGELEAARRRMSGLQMNTVGWGKRIEELAKQLGGVDSAGRAFNALLADMIRDSDITVNNFDQYILKVREIVSTFEQGNATIEETEKNFGAAFKAIAETANELGISTGGSMIGLIELAEQFGLDVKEISEYVEKRMNAAFESYKKIKNIQAINTEDIEKQIDSLTEKLKGLDIGSEEFKKTNDELERLNQQLLDVSAAQRVFGDLSISVFEDMLSYQEKVGQNETLITGIREATSVIENLASTQRLTQEQFSDFEKVAIKAYSEMEKAGFSTEDIYKELGPLLSQLDFLEREYGLTIDETTKNIINQGKEQDLLKEKGKSSADIMRQGFDNVVDALRLVARGLGVEIPDSIERMDGAIRRGVGNSTSAFGTLENSINRNVSALDDLGTEAERADDRITNAVSGNSMVPEFSMKLGPAIRGVIGDVHDLGFSIENLDRDIWGKSVKNMGKEIDVLTRQAEDLEKQIEAINKKKRKTDEDKELLKTYQGQLDALNKQIDALEEMNALREEALNISENLGSVLLTPENFGLFSSQIGTIITAFETGVITAKEFQQEVGASFNVLIGAAKDLGMEGSKHILQFIKTARSMGVEIPEISRYISDQLSQGIEKGLGTYLDSFADPSAIQDRIDELQRSLPGTKGRRRKDIVEEINKQNALLSKSIKDIEGNFESMGINTLALFNSLIAEGATFNEAIQKMGPQLQKLSSYAKSAGIEIDGSLKDVLDFQDFIDQNQTLFNRLDGIQKMMQSLGNTGFLTQEIFRNFEKDTAKIFKGLSGDAKDNKKALQAIAPQLGELAYYAQQYGFELDKGTKALIKRAKEEGIRVDKIIPAEERIADILERIAIAMGVEIPNAAETMSDSINKEVKYINDGLKGISVPDLTITPKFDLSQFKTGMADMGGGTDPLAAWQKNYDAIKAQINANRAKITATGLGGYKGTGLTYEQIKALQQQNTILWNRLSEMKQKKPEFATGGFIGINGTSNLDNVPVNFMAQPGEGVRIFSRKEMEEMRQANQGTGNQSYQTTNINNRFDQTIISNRDSEFELAQKLKNLARNNTAGWITEVTRQQKKRPNRRANV